MSRNGACVAASSPGVRACFDPCAGKVCGDLCSIACPSGYPCPLLAVRRACTADGQCVVPPVTCP
jgi:hypothetical protein